MKTCPTCDNPILKAANGALPTSSSHCPKCNAPISSFSPKTSPQSTIGSPPEIGTSSQNPISRPSLSDNRTAEISTGQLTEELQTSANPVKWTEKNESKPPMNTEIENPEPVLSEDNHLPNAEEREETRRLALTRQGFIVEEDAHGLRLSGVASRPGGLSSQLSPYDVVRLAAELEGGVVPIDQRKHCPKCNAVVCPGDKQCQWCSEPLDT